MLDLASPTDETLLRCQILSKARPFAALAADNVLALAQGSITRNVSAGTMILNEGERGEECYLIHEGEVAVLRSAGAEQELERGRIGPGGLFGELALLSDPLQIDSVRAVSDCRLLVLGRAHLAQAMADEQQVAQHVHDLIRFRDRPRQVPGILAFPQRSADGEEIVVLKDPAKRSYFRLSADGWKLWQSIDGELSVRDLIVQRHAATGRFDPIGVTDLLERLALGRFVETARLPEFESPKRPPLGRTIADKLGRLFTWQMTFTGCDGWISRLYAGGVWTLFTPIGLTLLAAFAVAGLGALVFSLYEGRVALAAPGLGGAMLGFLYVALILSVVLHEAGHAFATKYFGGEIDRVGVGWFWFGPVAFVNTSDMWTRGRKARIAVDLAGLAVNAICAGFAVFVARLIGHGPWAVVLWQFALTSWWMVLSNLNPLFEFDGFYALTDWLDRPNLRRDAFAVAWRPAEWTRHRFELLYAAAGLVFIASTGFLAIKTYTVLIEPWLAKLIGEQIAVEGVWLVALNFVLIAALQFAPALRDPRFRAKGV